METIRIYLENMFSRLPRTPEIIKLENDMLRTMEDKYEELYADCGYDNVEEMKKDYTDKEIEEAVLLDKAMDVVYDNANITKSYSLPK